MVFSELPMLEVSISSFAATYRAGDPLGEPRLSFESDELRENRFRELGRDLTEILPAEVDLGRSRRNVDERRSDELDEEVAEWAEWGELAEWAELAEFKFKLGSQFSEFSLFTLIGAVSSGCKLGFCSRNGDVSGSLFK